MNRFLAVLGDLVAPILRLFRRRRPIVLGPAGHRGDTNPAPTVDGPTDEGAPTRLAVSAPNGVPAGAAFTVGFAAFAPGREAEARELLEGLRGELDVAVHPGTQHWTIGTEVAVTCACPHAELVEPVQTFRWSGAIDDLVFDGVVVPDPGTSLTSVRLDVAIGGLVVKRLRMPMRLGTPSSTRSWVSSDAATSAFVSYSTSDLERVSDQVGALLSMARLDLFWDKLDLAPGEDWASRLREEILERDLFLLFWSAAAAASEEVATELAIARSKPVEDHIRMRMLEPGVAPPAGYEHVQIADPALWVHLTARDQD
ncbi:MAG: toll/interleukin-1 receptor domain-containing protein [Actinomycetota bacterium]